MNYQLSTIDEVAPIYKEDLQSVIASLMWLKDDDLDLMVFYKTKEGDTGGIYSSDLPGGDFGDPDQFPFISGGDGGTDEDHDQVVSYEKVYFNDLSPFEEIFFVVTNYSELVLKKQINFSEYKGLLKVSARYGQGKKESSTIKLTSEEKGSYLVVGKFEIGENLILIKNINKVMTFEEFEEKIPGANQLTF